MNPIGCDIAHIRRDTYGCIADAAADGVGVSERLRGFVLPRVALVKPLEARERVMSAHFWRDGRLFGFDRVEWLTWLVAITVLGVLALAVTI